MKLRPGTYRVKRSQPGALNLPRRSRGALQREIQRQQARTGQRAFLFLVGNNEAFIRTAE